MADIYRDIDAIPVKGRGCLHCITAFLKRG